MGNIAFYAPMKPPTHATPSGDRQMARALMAALGERAELVSELRLYDGKGDAAIQAGLEQQAIDEAKRLIAKGGWQAWVTYHNYYKAPDIIGPIVARALNIPYILIEATRSAKRLTGPWSRFAALAEAAINHADPVFYFTERDRVALEQMRPEKQRLVKLHPFLPRTDLPAPAPLTGKTILSVAMLRGGDKLDSFRIIADALPLLATPDWHLQIAGDGPARSEIETLFAPLAPRITFLGQLDRGGLDQAYHNADAFLWPGVNEAFGMVYLEAQAAGLPVVAQDRDGVRDVVLADGLVPTDHGPKALAQALDRLLGAPEERQTRGQKSRAFVAENHLLNTASETLWQHIKAL
jgi:glycosyltransferase involved in cell wall biosynthesis